MGPIKLSTYRVQVVIPQE